jgi:signal transduction histidine kinase
MVADPMFDNSRGRVFVFYGSAQGLASRADWSATGEQSASEFGNFGEGAGDSNGDGFDDLIVGAGSFRGGEAYLHGKAYLFCGSGTGLAASASWTFAERISDESRLWLAGKAGDVNGDRFADVFTLTYIGDQARPGRQRISIFHGSQSGLPSSPDVVWENEVPGHDFAAAIAAAGDVNGDGFGDLIVGQRRSSETPHRRGRVFVHYGSKSGLVPHPSWTATYELPTQKGLDKDYEQFFGATLASAGDVNGDGYSDVIIGAPYADHGDKDEGTVFVFHGSPSGLGQRPDWWVESNQRHALFGSSVAGAGDINRDGFDDVIIGAPQAAHGQINEGAAAIFLGTKEGLRRTPHWTAEGNDNNFYLGRVVARAGDVNGDGFSDVLVNIPEFWRVSFPELITLKLGRACLFYGSAEGMQGSSAWRIDKPLLVVLQEAMDRTRPGVKLGVLGFLVALVIALFAAWRRALWRIRKIERETARARERERIARDLHDEVGAHITQLARLGSSATKDSTGVSTDAAGLQAVSFTAREIARAFEQAVWAVRPDNDTLETLISFLGAQAPKFFVGSSTRCLLDLPVVLPDRKLPIEVTKNILLTVKEALNNVAKHAQGSEVWLRIRFDDPELTVLVEDNGRGVSGEIEATSHPPNAESKAPLASTSQGLTNMKKRMADIGGRFAIEHREGGGTRIKLGVRL